jgi:hypothetical protein
MSTTHPYVGLEQNSARSILGGRITRCGTNGCFPISRPACSQHIVFVIRQGKTQNGFPFAFLFLARSSFPVGSLLIPSPLPVLLPCLLPVSSLLAPSPLPVSSLIAMVKRECQNNARVLPSTALFTPSWGELQQWRTTAKKRKEISHGTQS